MSTRLVLCKQLLFLDQLRAILKQQYTSVLELMVTFLVSVFHFMSVSLKSLQLFCAEKCEFCNRLQTLIVKVEFGGA